LKGDHVKYFQLLSASVLAAFCTLAAAQVPNPPQQGAQPLPPVKVLADNRVTFQFKAADATKVSVQGDWPGGLGGDRTIVPMVKDDQGLWSVTVGPLASDAWNYTFLVDGVNVPPAQPSLVGTQSVLPPGKFVIPGAYGDDFGARDVAHGTVAYPFINFLGINKTLEVYTPAEYLSNPTKRYPVIYLSGYADLWERNANLHYLLDNLIASGRIQPMIAVVFNPDGPQGLSAGANYNAGGGAIGGPGFVTSSQAVADVIVPWMDKAYRTIADRDHRAISGFSGPGSLGFMTGANNPDKFAYIGTFSGGLPTWPGVGVQIQSTLDPKTHAGPDSSRVPDMKILGALIPKLTPASKFKLVYISYGTNEWLIQTEALFKKMLDERGVKYYAVEDEGYTHEWRHVRVALRDYLARIFE
jgi:enterochelin esterase family protein